MDGGLTVNSRCWLALYQSFPVYAAEEVLDRFRERFISEVDAKSIVFDLRHEDIIPEGDVAVITRLSSSMEQNEYLHHRLKLYCTPDALRRACDIIISVKSNPRMKALGRDMKRMLEGKCSACSCVSVCLCVI